MNDILGIIAVVSALMLALVQICFAVGIYQIARRREDFGGPGNWCVSSFVWGMATLFGGIFVAVAYWVIHCSRLSDLVDRQVD